MPKKKKPVTVEDLGVPYMTPEQVAYYFATTPSHIRGLVHRREIPFTKVGGRLRFKPEEIKAWAEGNTTTPNDYREWLDSLARRPVR